MQKLFGILLLLSTNAYAAGFWGASLNTAPPSVIINQPMGASLVINNYYSGSGESINVLSITPRGYIPTFANSLQSISMAWDKPALGNGQNVTVGPGQSLIFRYSAVFFAPSISPVYAGQSVPVGNGYSLVAAGRQGYSVDAVVTANDGVTAASNARSITVFPITLPDAQLQ